MTHCYFFFNDTATTEIYTLSLHDALPIFLNTFVWQDYDIAPDHPRLLKFIDFWKAEIEGPLHSVRFTHRKMMSCGEWRHVTGEFTLH